MRELHPSPTARTDERPTNAVLTGLHRDTKPYKATRIVWCRQCGFRCNLDRDARGLNEFCGDSITSGNAITNGTFENWTGSNPDDWTVSGSVTQATNEGYYDRDEFDKVGSDGNSCKVVRSGSDITLSQTLSTPSNFNSNQVYFGAKVKCATGGVIRLRIIVNGITYYSRYNRGQVAFESVSMTIKCPSTVSSISVSILADSQDATAYVDSVSLIRPSNPTTAGFGSGCPMCQSHNYY